MMASSMVKSISEIFLNYNYKYSPLFVVKRHSSAVKKPKRKIGKITHRNLIASSCESLASKGFLRSYKPYEPKDNVREIILHLCNKILGSNLDSNSALSREDKFTLLNSCFEELNHSVPNSLLHKTVSVNDIIDFYETPVSTTVPYDELKNQELPPNLHIQYDYVRFHPETDTLFKGISAFPKSSTIVTGITYKDKYKGYKAEESPYADAEAYIKKNFLF